MGKLGTGSGGESVRLILIFVISLFIIIYMPILRNIGPSSNKSILSIYDRMFQGRAYIILTI